MYVTALVTLVLIGQSPMKPRIERGLERGSLGAARQAYRNSQNIEGYSPSSAAKRVGTKNEAALNKAPVIDGPSSRTLSTGQWGKWRSSFRVVQVLGKDEMLATYYFTPEIRILKLRGFSTEDLADDDEFTLIECAKVAGTETYVTASGTTKTVHVLVPIPGKELDELLAKEKPTEPAVIKLGESRTWLVGGKAQRARLMDFRDGVVRLKRGDGQIISVSPNKLSRKDRDYLTKLQAENSKIE